jgi:hypothetical protein
VATSEAGGGGNSPALPIAANRFRARVWERAFVEFRTNFRKWTKYTIVGNFKVTSLCPLGIDRIEAALSTRPVEFVVSRSFFGIDRNNKN